MIVQMMTEGTHAVKLLNFRHVLAFHARVTLQLSVLNANSQRFGPRLIVTSPQTVWEVLTHARGRGERQISHRGGGNN